MYWEKKLVNFTCMSVLRTYLQDRDDAPVKLKSNVLATCSDEKTRKQVNFRVASCY